MATDIARGKPVVLSASGLCKTFYAGAIGQQVLRSLDIDIYAGDFTVIMGSSGAGKSTLLYALSGMDRPTSGKIVFDGSDISTMTSDQLAVFRRKNCGFVFQQNYLLEDMSIMDNVLACGLLVRGDRKRLVDDAKGMFAHFGLDEGIWSKFPAQVSGGEAQRAGIARALINQPKVVFADEPTGALNSASGKAVLDALTAVNRDGKSIVMVTHDLASARRGNRIIYLKDGAVCGERRLEPYDFEDKQRAETLQPFLEEMAW
ncbi:MAG: ABC transporter ATP-binding protein [Clostridiales bacterium]|nr:ABC transporter ATP-binding protein [Clostridiales bacterium]